MKKIAAILTSLALMITPISPLLANENQEFAERVSYVKSLVDIPDDLTEFRSGSHTSGTQTSYTFTWHTSEGGSYKSVDITIDSDNIIRNYYKNTNYPYTNRKKLSAFTKDQARDMARDFFQKINPSIANQFDFDAAEIHISQNPTVTVNRMHNGLKVLGDSVTIYLDSDMKQVSNMYLSYTSGATFASADGIISQEEAKKAIGDKAELTLNYALDQTGKNVHLLYVAKNSSVTIDAITGQSVDDSTYYLGYAEGQMAKEMAMNITAASGGAPIPMPTLSPNEKKEVDRVGKQIGVEKAEQIARSFEEFELDGYVMESSYTSQRYYGSSWADTPEETYQLSFRKQDAQGATSFKSVSLGADTGTLQSFYGYLYKEGGYGDEKMSEDEVLQKAESFLNKYKADRMTNARQVERKRYDEDREYYFYYVDTVNGIDFPGNSVSITYSPDGKLVSYGESWHEGLDFPSPDGALSVSDCLNKIYAQEEPTLAYYSVPEKMPTPYPVAEARANYSGASGSSRGEIVSVATYGATIDLGGPEQPEEGVNVEAEVDEKEIAEVAEDGAEKVVADDAIAQTTASPVAIPRPMPVLEEKTGQFIPVYVYSFSNVDAKTGNKLNYDFTPIEKNEPVDYKDLDGHYAQAIIEELIANNILFDTGSDMFMPDQEIKEQEYLALLSQCVYDYIVYPRAAASYSSINRMMLQNGVIDDIDINPEATLTREMAVVYLLKAMDYKKFASIPGIFRDVFTDMSEVSEDNVGYVAIAKGLNIVNGNDGAFLPKSMVTRAQAAVMVYNYLKGN